MTPDDVAGYDIEDDGRFIMVTVDSSSGDPSPLELYVVLNWFEELKELVPVP